MNAENGPLVPKKLEARISRTSPAMRERPVPIEKIAVLTEIRRRRGRGGTAASAAGASRLVTGGSGGTPAL